MPRLRSASLWRGPRCRRRAVRVRATIGSMRGTRGPRDQLAHDVAERGSLLRVEQPTVVAERRVRLSDRQLHLQDVRADDSKHLAGLGLRPHGAEQARGRPDDGDGLAAQRVFGERPRRPVERVLQRAGDRPVELRSGDQETVGRGDRAAQPRDRVDRVLGVEIGVVVRELRQAGGDLEPHPLRQRPCGCAEQARVVGPAAQASGEAEEVHR